MMLMSYPLSWRTKEKKHTHSREALVPRSDIKEKMKNLHTHNSDAISIF